jgi:hypothetical protein
MLGAAAGGQSRAGDAGTDPECPVMLERLSNRLAGGDPVGAVGCVDVAAVVQ